MTLTIPERAANFEDSYFMARSRGRSHVEAVDHAVHAFGHGRREHEFGDRIARVRARWDREHAEPLMVGDDVEEPPTAEGIDAEPDSFSEAESEIRARLQELAAQRGALSLDALTNKAKSSELADVESRIDTAQLELGRVGLARTEQQRREQAEREAEAQATVDAALRQASELQRDRDLAAAKVDRAARALGEALAKYQALALEQGHALIAAGLIADLRQSLAPDLAMEGAVACGLAGSAPWIDFSGAASVRFCRPLVEQDVRHVEAAK
jgi:pyruvate/2-oxoglutarate dehydrogenase complex dihydrolipoamide acyltransferase (E2) component